MKSTKKRKSAAPPPAGAQSHKAEKLAIGQTLAQADIPDHIVERASGFYWLSPEDRQEFGPFDARALALRDRDRFNEQAIGLADAIHDVERELDVSESIDPDSGEHGDSSTAPHLHEE